MRRATYLTASLVLVACHAEEVVRLALPEAPGDARSAFLATVPDEGLWLIDLQARTALPPLGDVREVVVAYYARTPEELGLIPGRIPPVSVGQPSDPLPRAPAWRTRLVPGQDAPPAWSYLEELPSELSARVLPRSTRCPSFVAHVYSLPKDGGALVATPSGRVLLGDRRGHFMEVTRDGLTPRPELDGRPSHAAVFSPEGELWSFGSDGRAARGPLDGPAIELPPAPHGDTINVVAGEVTPAGFVVHTLSTRGHVATLADSTWTVRVDDGGDADGYGRDLAVVGPGELIAVSRLSPTVRRIGSAGVMEEEVVRGETAGQSAVLDVPGFGVVVASSVDGQLFRSTEPRVWSRMPGARTALVAYALAIDGSRLYAAGARGAMIEVDLAAGATVCPIDPLVSGAVEQMVVPAPGTLVMLASDDGTFSPSVAWVDRR